MGLLGEGMSNKIASCQSYHIFISFLWLEHGVLDVSDAPLLRSSQH